MTILPRRHVVRSLVLAAGLVCAGIAGGVAVTSWVPGGSAPIAGNRLLIDAGCIAAITVTLLLCVRAERSSRRRSESTLAGQVRQLALLTDGADAGLVEWDLRTAEPHFCDRWCRHLGYGDAEIADRLPQGSPVIHPDDGPRIRAQVQGCLANSGGEVEAIVRMRLRDGSWRSVLIRGAFLPRQEGRAARMVGILLDLTERQRVDEDRRKLQAQVLESQKLESLGLLAGGIAHDFNNLLSGVLSNAELAQLDLPSTSPVSARIEHIKKAALRMADLSREILAYSGRGPFNVTCIDLNQLVSEMSNLLTTSVSKRVRLGFEFAPTPVIVKAEATQIRQVVMNLITNASDAMNHQSGNVTLTTGIVKARRADFEGVPWAADLPDGLYAYFEVTDSGCGMNAETIGRMFEPFYTTKPHGRGLGLAAVQGIVRSHHGALQIRSTLGHGTRIRVLLPFDIELGTPMVEDDAPAATWQGTGTILVIDDDQIARDTVSTQLARLGFEVIGVPDGDEACRCFQRSPRSIRAVLLDATIPGPEGQVVVARLRSGRPDLPVLLTSGYSEKEVMVRYAGVPIEGFVPKPVELGTLRHLLFELLRDRTSRPAGAGAGEGCRAGLEAA